MKYNEMPESSTKIDINYNKGTLYVKSKANPGHLNWIFTLGYKCDYSSVCLQTSQYIGYSIQSSVKRTD